MTGAGLTNIHANNYIFLGIVKNSLISVCSKLKLGNFESFAHCVSYTLLSYKMSPPMFCGILYSGSKPAAIQCAQFSFTSVGVVCRKHLKYWALWH